MVGHFSCPIKFCSDFHQQNVQIILLSVYKIRASKHYNLHSLFSSINIRTLISTGIILYPLAVAYYIWHKQQIYKFMHISSE